ncbi:MAG: ribonuclease HII [Kiritimatiellaceae bacterium]|nr:ribonuclease HII [Kiritimatiellaceae bacterium]
MPDVLLYEKEAWASGFLRLAGIDEAGRGPLAGPVVAAAVMFDPGHLQSEVLSSYSKLTDSKVVNEARREEFYKQLMESEFTSVGVGIINAEEVDQINILKATHKAMAIAASKIDPQYALVDGLPVKGLPCESRSIVKGDVLSISISAASIIAKVTRDRIMVSLDEKYPVYGFSSHKGYGTKKHLEALRKFGASPVHRKSFRPVAELDQLDLPL